MPGHILCLTYIHVFFMYIESKNSISFNQNKMEVKEIDGIVEILLHLDNPISYSNISISVEFNDNETTSKL